MTHPPRLAHVFFLFVVLPLTSTNAAHSDALKPKGTPVPVRLELPISIAANATAPERKAAEDLRHWLGQIIGSAPELRAGDAGGPVTRIAIDDKLAPDGYRIEVNDGRLALYGAPGRGVSNAVYALLEEDLGCRFYTNESIRLPTKTGAPFSVVARAYAPRLRLRDPFYFASFDPNWSLRNRTNAPDAKVPEEHGGRMDYGPLFVHTHATLLPTEKHFKLHPEYFAARAGSGERHAAQICPTHPDVAKIVIDNVRKILVDNPHTEIISISKNDNQEQCHDPNCEKLRAAEGSEMAVQLYLVNKVAETLAREHQNLLVDTLAYLDTIPVPRTVRPCKNVVIRLCNDSVGAWSRPFTPARQMPVANIARQWGAVHDKLSVWDYNVNFSHFPAPMPNMHIIADNLRFWVDNRAIGVLTQGGYQSRSERDELRSWVIAKLMWDPSLDLAALEKDFIEGHYGAAAPMMAEYEALLKQSAQAHANELASPPGGIRYPMTIGLLNRDFLARATDIFERAKRAAGNDQTLLNRVERGELAILYVKCAQGMAAGSAQYPAIVDRFEKLAGKHGVVWILEGATKLDAQLAAWRKEISAAATKPGGAG